VCEDRIKGAASQAEEENLDVFSESQLTSRLKQHGPSVKLFPCVYTQPHKSSATYDYAEPHKGARTGQLAYLSVAVIVQIERDYI
jgi:hypothetical protein